jgi:thiamine pyrophosphokinase
MNFVLYNNNKEVASVQYMNGKYLTFELPEGFTIAEDKTEKFTVKADVIA